MVCSPNYQSKSKSVYRGGSENKEITNGVNNFSNDELKLATQASQFQPGTSRLSSMRSLKTNLWLVLTMIIHTEKRYSSRLPYATFSTTQLLTAFYVVCDK